MKENPLNKRLNPCPFCGGKAEIRMTKYGGSYVICTNCFCRTTDGGMGIAVCLWNRRKETSSYRKKEHGGIGQENEGGVEMDALLL